MKENVIIKLCDFHSKSSDNNFKMLKNKLRESNEIAFSLKWEPLYEIPKSKLLSGEKLSKMNIYDVLVIPNLDLLIFGANSKLVFFNLTSRTHIQSVYISDSIHKIVNDGNYLYVTTGEQRLMKFNLFTLLKDPKMENSLIWKSQLLSNCWGLALCQLNYKKYAFVMDYDDGILVFDCELGQQEVKMKIPKIKRGFGIAFTDENEMIISTADSSLSPIQIYIFNNESQNWQLSRQIERIPIFVTPYGICYERKSQLIYLVDTFAKRVFVFDKNTMKMVMEWKVFEKWQKFTFYGIHVDSKNGHVYLPLVDSSIQILK